MSTRLICAVLSSKVFSKFVIPYKTVSFIMFICTHSWPKLISNKFVQCNNVLFLNFM